MSAQRKRQTKFRRQHRAGATATEFAIVAPIFFLFIFVSFEFSRLNVIRHTADSAAYEAARQAMVPGATSADAVAKAHRVLNVAGARAAVVEIAPTVLNSNTEEVTVTIDVPLDQNGWVIPRFIGSRTMHAEASLRTERGGQ